MGVPQPLHRRDAYGLALIIYSTKTGKKHYNNLTNLATWAVMTHKYRGSQQSSREVKPKFIDSTQGEPKNIYKP
jgi:hypothetical protein